MLTSRGFLALSIAAFLLALCVVILGAYVRLSNAGLGCPDWPGCYGRLFVTADMVAQQASGDRPFDRDKAVKEMMHRYAAGALGILVVLMALISWRSAHREKTASSTLLFLVVLQALLGMWTVTELLKPIIVVAHLLGGMLVLGLLYWIILRQLPRAATAGRAPGTGRKVLAVALAVLAVQMFSGGWTSANYAALICPEFPACRGGAYWPETDFKEAFVLRREGRINYEGGILDAPARTAIHLTHRLGAALTFLVILPVALCAMRRPGRPTRLAGGVLLLALCAQVSLGIANVLLRLPLPVAVAHNSVAALLMLSLLTLYWLAAERPEWR